MTSTPSPDTVEPTAGDLLLAERIVTFRSYEDAARLIRQHVAAEVDRETAELARRLKLRAVGMIAVAKEFGEPPHQEDLDDLALATARKSSPQ